jgi:hypothetical protein
MKALTRGLAAALLLTVAACGQPAAPKAEAPAQAPAEGETRTTVTLSTARNSPDWLLVARQRDCPRPEVGPDTCVGEVHFNQRTITRTPDGMADVWVQVRHGAPQLYDIETETRRTSIRYELQRLHYRFNCNTEQFIVVERQIMGANEQVVARDQPRAIWRAPAPRSATHIVMPIACRGG